MGILSSIPFVSAGGSVLGVTISMLSVTLMLALWVLVLLILHPIHATIFLSACIFEYFIIDYFGFDLWIDFFTFFGFYIAVFAIYSLGLRRLLPLPKSDIENLIKLSELKQKNLLSEEEFKAAKKRLLKL
ncbi:MAG: SHOCT domain-containing protein [Alphaproteobacteria bacterium]|nr:SHOCT domain-containing protein [Alphaproteobacteria bacterium]